jgi:sugar lactone lactonase YvrE
MMRRRLAMLVAVTLLSGCGGGGGSTTSNAIAPATASTPSSHSAAQFTITVPNRTAQSRTKYVSANTQSLVVLLSTVNGQPYTGASTAVNLVPSNPDCSGSPMTCSFSVFAVPGTDVFTISTYDATQSSSSPAAPTGNLLSQGTISVTINANQTNVVTTPLVLNGIAVSYTATFSDQHITGAQSTGYYIAGNRPVTMTVSAQDASGATIVGVGAQPVQVSSGSSAISITAAGTNTYTVQTASYASSPITFTMSSSGGATTNFSMNTAQELYTSLYAIGKVVGYALLPTGPSAITNDTISGFCAPWGLAFDSSWNLWVNDFGCGIVYAYNGTTQIASDTISNSNAPYGLAFESTGELWIMNCGGSCIGSGSGDAYGYVGTTQTTTVTAGIDEPISVAFDSSGNMWVGNLASEQVTAYSMSGTPSQIVADTISINKPTGLAFDSAGHLWITSCGNACGGTGSPTLQEWNVSGTPSIIASGSGLTQPEMIAFDYSGFLWIADHNGNAVKQYSGTTATGTNISFSSGRPAAVAIEP